MKVYTKTGDNGTTGTYSGARRSKGDSLFQVLGETDKLIVQVGRTITSLNYSFTEKANLSGRPLAIKNQITEPLTDSYSRIQDTLFKIQSICATTKSDAEITPPKELTFDESETIGLEKEIDALTKELPKLTKFVKPVSNQIAFFDIHETRVVCRTIERMMVNYNENADPEDKIPETVMKYINRLSDLFFTFARYFQIVCAKETESTVNIN